MKNTLHTILLALAFTTIFGSIALANPGMAPAASSISGKVLETIDASDYTYLKLKTASGETWAAVNKAKITKGSEVTIEQPLKMDGFESKTLKRKFDHIVFGMLGGKAAMAAPADMNSNESPESRTHGPKVVTPDLKDIKVEKAKGENAYTVEELYIKKAELKGKAVLVRGKVVKFTGRVMGKNWVHLRDGSGKESAQTHDITVVTQDMASVGDVVTAQGTCVTDKDLGAGYKYSVLIESAKLSK